MWDQIGKARWSRAWSTKNLAQKKQVNFFMHVGVEIVNIYFCHYLFNEYEPTPKCKPYGVGLGGLCLVLLTRVPLIPGEMSGMEKALSKCSQMNDQKCWVCMFGVRFKGVPGTRGVQPEGSKPCSLSSFSLQHAVGHLKLKFLNNKKIQFGNQWSRCPPRPSGLCHSGMACWHHPEGCG